MSNQPRGSSEESATLPASTAGRYAYRCTTGKLLEHMARIEEAGDVVRAEHFVGGRDWLLIVERGPRTETVLRAGDVVPGVPRTISRDDLRSMLATIGLSTADLTELHMLPGGIRAVVFALDEDGERQVTRGAVAKHELHIEVVD